MTERVSSFRSPRIFIWAAVAVLAVAGVWMWRRSRAEPANPAAFVLALDASSRVRSRLWTRPVGTPLTIAVGETVSVPEGARVRIIHADGRVEDVSGPATRTFAAADEASAAEGAFLQPPLAEMAAIVPRVDPVTAGSIRITSPVGVTRFVVPVVSWQARAEAIYDVAIIDPADPDAPPRIAKGVKPPVSVADLVTTQRRRLSADRSYEIYVRESGHDDVVGGARVFVSVDASDGKLPTEPAELLTEAVNAMAKKPTRTGDAWTALSRLPPEWRESELGVRLRLRVAAELGLADELAQAQEAAQRLIKR